MLALITPRAGIAQTESDVEPDGSAEGPIMMDTIIVEGQRIDRGFLSVYDSVGILDAETIERFGGDDLRDTFSLLGNVRLPEGERGENTVVIRGIGAFGVTPDNGNNSPATSFIIDGVTQSAEAIRRGSRGLWDVQQVEVFRGPQSTLQGRGAIAGAVIVETADPTFFWEAAARGRIGEEEQLDGAFMVSGPIIEDQLAFRLSGEARQRDLDIEYDIEANEVLSEDRFRQLRGKLLFEPEAISGLSVLLSASTTFDRPGVRAVNGTDFFARQFTAGGNSRVEFREARNDNFVAEIAYELGDNAVLRSITTFVDSETTISTAEGFAFSRDETRSGEDFTQDLRLEFGEDQSEFSGVVGAFFGRFTLPRDSLVEQVGIPVPIQDLVSDDKTTTRSIYADLRWRPLPRVTLLGGGRFTFESLEEETVGVSLGQDVSFTGDQDYTVFLPKLGVAYDLTDSQSIGFTAQRGYRSGFIEVANGLVNQVDPEFVWNYELAYRAESPNGRWNLGANLFYADYSDQQIVIPATLPALPQTENAGSSRSIGAEIEGRYRFDFGLDLYGSLGLIDTEFTDFRTAGGDFTGNEFPDAPTVTGALGAIYRHPTGLFASGTFTYTGQYFSTGSIDNDPSIEVDSFYIVDIRAGYKHENFTIVAFVDNLLDEEFLTNLDNNGVFGAVPLEANIGDSRRFGVGVTARF